MSCVRRESGALEGRSWSDLLLSLLSARQIDVSGGDKIPRKGGPGISQSDLLIINKVHPSPLPSVISLPSAHSFPPLPFQTDLAPHVGASLEVMKRDADLMRDHGPTQFTSIRNGEGVEACVELILGAFKVAMAGGGGGKGKAKVVA